MTKIKNYSISPDEIKRYLLDAWQTGHGGDPEHIHFLQGENLISLMIPRAFYQAEKKLFNSANATSSTRILNQYIRTLLETVADEAVPLIEKYSSRRVTNVIPLIDLEAGWITALYKLEAIQNNREERANA
jgi:hypothetical protein